MTPLTARESMWVEPLEPQPYTVRGYERWYRMPSGGLALNCYDSPYQPGQIIDGKRITSVEYKMVKDVTEEEIEMLGFRKPPVGQEPPKGPIRTCNDFKVWWTVTYPSIPFDKAWVWLISAKLVKEE